MAADQPSMPKFRLITQGDLALIHEWIQRPHVAEWWGSPSTIADIEQDYLPSIEGSSTTRAYIALLGVNAIGFIQCYVVKDSGNGWWSDEQEPGARGIDQFLAEAHQLNQGLGTAMITAFLALLFEDQNVSTVQTDPDPLNHRAIRAYTKAGFRTVGPVQTPDGLALLMRCDRSSFACSGI